MNNQPSTIHYPLSTIHHSPSTTSAFTILEIIFVILIITILAAIGKNFLPDFTLLNDTNYLAMKIREKQHNAIGYDHFRFGDTGWENRDYSKEYNLTCIDLNITKQREENSDKKSNLDYEELNSNSANKYYIDYLTKINVTGLNSTNQTLCFDHLGRPYDGNYSLEQLLLDKNVIIKLTYKGESKRLIIQPFSGYITIE